MSGRKIPGCICGGPGWHKIGPREWECQNCYNLNKQAMDFHVFTQMVQRFENPENFQTHAQWAQRRARVERGVILRRHRVGREGEA